MSQFSVCRQSLTAGQYYYHTAKRESMEPLVDVENPSFMDSSSCSPFVTPFSTEDENPMDSAGSDYAHLTTLTAPTSGSVSDDDEEDVSHENGYQQHFEYSEKLPSSLNFESGQFSCDAPHSFDQADHDLSNKFPVTCESEDVIRNNGKSVPRQRSSVGPLWENAPPMTGIYGRSSTPMQTQPMPIGRQSSNHCPPLRGPTKPTLAPSVSANAYNPPTFIGQTQKSRSRTHSLPSIHHPQMATSVTSVSGPSVNPQVKNYLYYGSQIGRSSSSSSVAMTSMPAPALPPVMEVKFQDDMHWERLALNSASSLPAPVPEIPYYSTSSARPLQESYSMGFESLGFGGSYVERVQNRRKSHCKGLKVAHEHLFTSCDPQSDRLAEFVSKMVFVIFWQGGNAFDIILTALKNRSRSSVGEVILEQANCPLVSAFRASPEFVKYTKYLLQTMQISCSTALLSLFYLYRLRPRVQHMFVPGTFSEHAKSGSKDDSTSRYQYRRDPKLEYRLFTIAVVLANKYLDDNSYSNKAWSDVTGLELRKINVMEQEFMKYIDYNLAVDEDHYVAWVNWLEGYIGSVMNKASQQFSFEPVRSSAALIQQRRCSLPATPLYYPKHFSSARTPNHSQATYLPTPSSLKKPVLDYQTQHQRLSRRHSLVPLSEYGGLGQKPPMQPHFQADAQLRALYLQSQHQYPMSVAPSLPDSYGVKNTTPNRATPSPVEASCSPLAQYTSNSRRRVSSHAPRHTASSTTLSHRSHSFHHHHHQQQAPSLRDAYDDMQVSRNNSYHVRPNHALPPESMEC